MNKIGFSILVTFAAINARADFILPPGHNGGYASDPTQRIAESFQFAQTSTIGSLNWWGGYLNPPANSDTLSVQLYADSGGHPGSLLSGFGIGPINQTATGDFVSSDLYAENKYSADLLTPFVAQAGTTYWLSITYSATKSWLWENSTITDINSGLQGSFQNGPWQLLNDRTALQLVVVPEPGTAALASLGIASCYLVCRRRKLLKQLM